MLTVTLSHMKNPDLLNGYWNSIGRREKNKTANVKDFREAVDVCIGYIDRNILGAGNWTGGAVYQDGVQIASIAFSGRVFNVYGEEIKEF